MGDDHIVILDGGMGRELERIGAPFSQPYWSAQALMEAPDMVADVHRHFIQSGAQIITTNCYAVVPPHIGKDLFHQRGKELITLSAQLARQEADAENENNSSVQVAACVPPVFGSYQPQNFNSDVALDHFFCFFEEQEPYADLFLAETISSLEEMRVIIDAYQKLGSNKPLWLAFALDEFFDETAQPQLRSGESLDNVLQETFRQDIARAILFNCCSVEDVSAAFDKCGDSIQGSKAVKFGAYANVFKKITDNRSPNNDLSELREDITPEAYLEYAQNWVQKGAQIIGGCCGIGPEYIAYLSKRLVS